MSYWVTVQVINEKAISGKPFSTREINERTLRRGGIPRVDLCYQTSCYLRDMVSDGYLQTVGSGSEDNLFQATEKFINIITARPEYVKKGIRVDLMETLFPIVAAP